MEVAENFELFFPHFRFHNNFDKKFLGLHFRAIFSQAHLVTLVAVNPLNKTFGFG
jgi:hypothetical protein